jgi:hypothetical protein
VEVEVVVLEDVLELVMDTEELELVIVTDDDGQVTGEPTRLSERSISSPDTE